MVGSWCVVEIVRYIFYAFKLVAKEPEKIPFPLFWLRYSLFMILYPSGITGEILQIFTAFSSADASPMLKRFALFIFCLYAPGSPFMIMNMFRMRKRAFKGRDAKKNPKSAPKARGLSWPKTNPKDQPEARSSTVTNKAIWHAAATAVGMEKDIEKTKNWRFGYAKNIMKNVKRCLQSPEDSLKVARAGLAKAHELFTFADGGEEIPFSVAMDKIKGSFTTVVVSGKGERGKQARLHYRDQSDGVSRQPGDDDFLTGEKLKEQVDKWVKYGSIEKSCGDAIKAVADNEGEWCDLSDRYFVILGATSAMGPIKTLLYYGANVIAIDVPNHFCRPSKISPNPNAPWSGKLFPWVLQSAGTLIIPVEEGFEWDRKDFDALAKKAGSNLLTQTPQIARWLTTDEFFQGKQLTIGNYTYLDGARHVQLSLACDAIMQRVCEQKKDTMLCFLCTPTDDHVITQEAWDAAKANYANAPFWQKILANFGMKKNVVPKITSDAGQPLYVVDAISVAQGPNYALAKRIQHWRAMVAFSNGCWVSSNVAPSSRTASVVSNKLFELAYNGMHAYTPMEVTHQETSNTVMGALLIHDMRNKEGHANPGAAVNKELENPLCLFRSNSFHGGVWRTAYTLNTIGTGAVLYALRNKIYAGLAGVGAVVGFVIHGYGMY